MRHGFRRADSCPWPRRAASRMAARAAAAATGTRPPLLSAGDLGLHPDRAGKSSRVSPMNTSSPLAMATGTPSSPASAPYRPASPSSMPLMRTLAKEKPLMVCASTPRPCGARVVADHEHGVAGFLQPAHHAQVAGLAQHQARAFVDAVGQQVAVAAVGIVDQTSSAPPSKAPATAALASPVIQPRARSYSGLPAVTCWEWKTPATPSMSVEIRYAHGCSGMQEGMTETVPGGRAGVRPRPANGRIRTGAVQPLPPRRNGVADGQAPVAVAAGNAFGVPQGVRGWLARWPPRRPRTAGSMRVSCSMATAGMRALRQVRHGIGRGKRQRDVAAAVAEYRSRCAPGRRRRAAARRRSWRASSGASVASSRMMDPHFLRPRCPPGAPTRGRSARSARRTAPAPALLACRGRTPAAAVAGCGLRAFGRAPVPATGRSGRPATVSSGWPAEIGQDQRPHRPGPAIGRARAPRRAADAALEAETGHAAARADGALRAMRPRGLAVRPRSRLRLTAIAWMSFR